MNERPTCPHCGENNTKIHQHRVADGVPVTRLQCQSCNKTFTINESVEVKADNSATGDFIETDGYEALACSSDAVDIPTEAYVRRAFDIDDSWICTHKRGNVWPSGLKQMHHGRYNFIPSKPVKCEWPTVRPLDFKGVQMQVGAPSNRKVKRAIVCGDAQIGFFRNFDTNRVSTLHDMRCFSLLNQAIAEELPDILVLDGDMLDLPDWSDHFIVSPEFAYTTQLSINWFASWLRFIRPFCGRIIYVYGNHEERLPRNIVNNVKAAYRLKPANMPEAPPALSLESLLGLDAIGVEYIPQYPQGEFWLNSNLKIIHGTKVGAKSGQTAMKMLDGARTSTMQGHVHRSEQAHVTVHGHGKSVTYGAYSLGCLCRIDGVVPGSKGQDNWQQGFSVIDYTDDLFQVHPINIWGDSMVYFGHEYMADVDNAPLTEGQVSSILMGQEFRLDNR